MTIIRKQSIYGTIISVIGAIIAFISSSILQPIFLSEEEIGLLRVIISYSLMFGVFASFGFNQITTRLFPYFKDEKTGHNGFLTLALVFAVIGSLVFHLLIQLLRPFLIANAESTLDINPYVPYISLVGISFLIYAILDTYQIMHFKSTTGMILKEVTQRVLVLLAIALFGWGVFSLHSFIQFSLIAYCIPTILLIAILIFRKNIYFGFKKINFKNVSRKEVFKAAKFGISTTGIAILLKELDITMIKQMKGLGATGTYSVLFNYAILIVIPARSVLRISTGVLSDAWKKNDLTKIKDVYYKSSNNLLAVAVFLFLGVWCNLEFILEIIKNGENYLPYKNILLFAGLAQIVELGSGVNSQIIATSKYYRYNFYFTFVLLVLIISTNLLLIPGYGVIGAAIGTLISMTVFNVLRFLFLYIKFRFNPFNINTVKILLIGLFLLLGIGIMDIKINPILNILVIGGLITLIYPLLLYKTNAAPDIIERINVYWMKIKKIISNV